MRTRIVPAAQILACPDLRLDAGHYVRGHSHGPRSANRILSVEQVSLNDVPWFSSQLAPILSQIEALPEGQALKVTAADSRAALTLRNSVQNTCNRRGIPVRTSGRDGDRANEPGVFYVWRGVSRRQKKVAAPSTEGQ